MKNSLRNYTGLLLLLVVTALGCSPKVQNTSLATLRTASGTSKGVASAAQFVTLEFSDKKSVLAGCAGTLIAPRLVLTASHCTTGSKDARIILPSKKTAFISQAIYRYDWTRHARRGSKGAPHDVALVVLDRPAGLSTYAQIAKSPCKNCKFTHLGGSERISELWAAKQAVNGGVTAAAFAGGGIVSQGAKGPLVNGISLGRDQSGRALAARLDDPKMQRWISSIASLVAKGKKPASGLHLQEDGGDGAFEPADVGYADGNDQNNDNGGNDNVFDDGANAEGANAENNNANAAEAAPAATQTQGQAASTADGQAPAPNQLADTLPKDVSMVDAPGGPGAALDQTTISDFNTSDGGIVLHASDGATPGPGGEPSAAAQLAAEQGVPVWAPNDAVANGDTDGQWMKVNPDGSSAAELPPGKGFSDSTNPGTDIPAGAAAAAYPATPETTFYDTVAVDNQAAAANPAAASAAASPAAAAPAAAAPAAAAQNAQANGYYNGYDDGYYDGLYDPYVYPATPGVGTTIAAAGLGSLAGGLIAGGLVATLANSSVSLDSCQLTRTAMDCSSCCASVAGPGAVSQCLLATACSAKL